MKTSILLSLQFFLHSKMVSLCVIPTIAAVLSSASASPSKLDEGALLEVKAIFNSPLKMDFGQSGKIVLGRREYIICINKM
ncbi:unnamed protein product [Cuscuta campestris]|uniref:Uncharacterized protein n=1 Tax=Cuscuta campestris TaxID=132261 RepID=A0A484KXH6_9ASTE|nr:unnamed protein product [Cuscuta campestris]